MSINYGQLRELIKDKPDEEEVIISHIEWEYCDESSLENFLIDNKLVLG